MFLTLEEINVLKTTLIMEWEVKQGIEWIVDGINIPKLVKKLENYAN